MSRPSIYIMLPLVFICFLMSCTKDQEVVLEDPTACFEIKDLEVSISESVVFENCSQSDICILQIYKASDYVEGAPNNEPLLDWDFNENKSVAHQFDFESRFVAEIFCQNKQPGSAVIVRTKEFEITE